MRRFKGVMVLLLCFQFSIAQNKTLDSLKNELKIAKTNESRLAVLEEIIKSAFGTDMQLALTYSLEGVKLADKIKNKNEQPKFYEMAGRMYANLLKLDSAVYFFDKAMKGYSAVNNKKGQATTWQKIAWVFKKKQQLDKAMEADMKSLRLMEEINDINGTASALGRVSDDLTRQGRMDEAIKYSQQAIELCKKNYLKEDLMFAYFNAGNVYIAMKQDEKALNYYNKAIEIVKEQKMGNMSLCDLLNSRANALKHLKRYDEALKEYINAGELAKASNYTNAIAATTANIGEVNMILKNYPEALKYQLKTIALMEEKSDKANLVENYLHLSNTYEKLKNYPEALKFQKKALLLRDSTSSIESDSTMSALLTQYEVEKSNGTISKQLKELRENRRIQLLTAGMLILLFALLIILYRSYRARTKSNRLLALKNSENELLLKEIHHRVKNNLEVISSLLALQSAQTSDPDTKGAILESQNRVQSVGIIHQKLYKGSNLGLIEMKDYFLNLSENILDSFGADKKINIELAMENLMLDIDTAVPLGLIVNELLTNTIKYAFPGISNGNVTIKLQKQPNEKLNLEVSDNGVGDSGNIKGTGFGSMLIGLLTKQLNGKMREEINNGTKYYFEFNPAI